MLLINSAEHSTPLNPSPDRLARDHQSNAEEELDRVWMQTYRTAGGPIFPGVQTGSTGIKRQCELNDECICIRNRLTQVFYANQWNGCVLLFWAARQQLTLKRNNF